MCNPEVRTSLKKSIPGLPRMRALLSAALIGIALVFPGMRKKWFRVNA